MALPQGRGGEGRARLLPGERKEWVKSFVWLFNGYRVPIWDAEKVLEMNRSDGCSILLMYLKALTYTLKNS